MDKEMVAMFINDISQDNGLELGMQLFRQHYKTQQWCLSYQLTEPCDGFLWALEKQITYWHIVGSLRTSGNDCTSNENHY